METYFYNGLNSEGFFDVDKWGSSVGKYIDNPEYLHVTLDSSNKIIEDIKKDGIHEFCIGLNSKKIQTEEINLNDTKYHVSSNPEYIQITTDKDGKIICGIKDDGTSFDNVNFESHSINSEKAYIRTLKCGKIHIEDIDITDEENLYFERPNFASIYIYGYLPTDGSEERRPTHPTVTFKVNGVSLFKANSSMSIQGHGSAGYPKKNYTLDLLNANGDALSVKFGDMIAVDSYHLKGYGSDRTHTRGVGCPTVWRDFVSHLSSPENKVNNIPLNMSFEQEANSIFIGDAKYSEDGFTCALYVNDVFSGLHTLKLKKTRQNYAMEKSIKSEIFLDSITYAAYLDKPFDHKDWEVKNPKIKKYEEGGEITDAAVLSSIERFFAYLNTIMGTCLSIADAESNGWRWEDSEDGGVWTKNDYCVAGAYTDEIARKLPYYTYRYNGRTQAEADGWSWSNGIWTKDDVTIRSDYTTEDAKNLPIFDKVYSTVTKAERHGWTWNNGVWSHPLFGEVEGEYTDAVAQTLPTSYTEASRYIVLQHWLLYIMFCEVIGHWDVNGNNTELFTWDNVHWSILPYDMDGTLGLSTWGFDLLTEYNGYIMEYFNNKRYFFSFLRDLFYNEIRSLYTNFRNEKIIETSKIYMVYKSISSNIPRDIQKADKELFGNWFMDNKYPTIEQIYVFLENRINYLDSKWLLN